ncbi:hypothetical protein LSTR_LSTR013997 [Laodelphax striatellus]|uniref:Uncharacterized protein n=1 Tax=Laodelphax striatellus TaxID=195883 RepID=A0A482WW65_LAOST|nr:hypothetical protein LSTR_LSTR013997 [Laodelphax striatellus]
MKEVESWECISICRVGVTVYPTSDAHRIELRHAPSATTTTMHIGDAVDSKQTDADTKVNQEPDHSCIIIFAEFAQCESREKGGFQIFSAPNEYIFEPFLQPISVILHLQKIFDARFSPSFRLSDDTFRLILQASSARNITRNGNNAVSTGSGGWSGVAEAPRQCSSGFRTDLTATVVLGKAYNYYIKENHSESEPTL